MTRRLGQSFTAAEPFVSVGGSFPTWATTGGAVTLSLYREGPEGKRVGSQRFADIVDNGWLMLELKAPQAPGKYYLEASAAQGKVGWWSTGQGTRCRTGRRLPTARLLRSDRSLRIVPADDKNNRSPQVLHLSQTSTRLLRGPDRAANNGAGWRSSRSTRSTRRRAFLSRLRWASGRMRRTAS